MTREAIEAALAQVKAEGWLRVEDAKPDANERVEVMHILSRSYDTTGECDANGKWQCSNGFILPSMVFTFVPTHWRPTEMKRSAQA